MADDDHPVLFAELDVAVRSGKGIDAGLGMHQSPFEDIFGCGRIEFGFCEESAPWVLSGALGIVQGGANQEIILAGILQRALRGRVVSGAVCKNACQQKCKMSFHRPPLHV